MAPKSSKFKWTDAATWAGTLFALATTNWVVLLSAAVALGAGLSKDAFAFLSDPHNQMVGRVFIWSLWTFIGLSFLYRIHVGIKTQPFIDYAFGIIIENISLTVDQDDDGNFQPVIQFRNVVNAAIGVQVTDIRTVIDGRTNPDTPSSRITVPRLGQKGIIIGLFKKSDITGKGKIEGQVDITIEYGPHDGEPVRRLRIKSKLYISPPVSGLIWGFGNEHISEEDKPI